MNTQPSTQSGQELIEYGLVIALVAILTVLVVNTGGTITGSSVASNQSTMTTETMLVAVSQSSGS